MSISGIQSAFVRSSLTTAVVLACLIGGGLVARASDEGSVDVGGEHILTVRFPAGGMTIRQRAEAVTDRLVEILSNPELEPADIIAVPVGKTEAKIMVKDKLLITVDEETARFNHSKPMTLAQTWLSHLRDVLPEINVQPNSNDTKAPPKHAAPAKGRKK